MSQFIARSIAEQVAEHLRGHILARFWRETIPGGHKLAVELGVNHKTVEAALRQLEAEGLLRSQGPGKPRLIAANTRNKRPRSIRIGHLLMETSDRAEHHQIELRHLLEEAGHSQFYPGKTMLDLGMDARRIERLVTGIEADAWIIGAGSKQVLEWFSQQATPAFALFGRRDGLPIAGAGPDKGPPMADAARHLIKFGHRRITFILRQQHRRPTLSPIVRAFFDELEAHGIQISEYNLPDWTETREGFQSILESLFRLTPPTAIFADESFLFIAAQQFLARRGIRVPEDVSLVCTDYDPSFAWCQPSVAHISWDYMPVVRCAVRWAVDISLGRPNLRQIATTAKFVKGGTVGPAPEG